jgi:hypothetical protein
MVVERGRDGFMDQTMIKPLRKIFVTVQGGIAEACEETVPKEIDVEILDFDNFEVDPEREVSCWSKELREYWLTNHKAWGRCKKDCPCRFMRAATE